MIAQKISSATGFSPAYLNFGRELRMPLGLAQECAIPPRGKYQNRIDKLQSAVDLARRQIACSFQKQQGHYNLRRRKWAPEIGDNVPKGTHFLFNKIGSFNAKLAEKFYGPFTVVKKVSNVIFDLKDAKGVLHRQIHVKDLTPCRKDQAQNHPPLPQPIATTTPSKQAPPTHRYPPGPGIEGVFPNFRLDEGHNTYVLFTGIALHVPRGATRFRTAPKHQSHPRSGGEDI